MLKLKLAKKVVDFLKKNANEKFTARDIAQWVFKNYPNECADKKDRTEYIKSDGQLIQQLVAEISAQRIRMQKNNPEIKTTEERPRKYYFTTQTDQTEIEEAKENVKSSTTSQNNKSLSEHSLYPMLSSFLLAEYGIYSKRINESCSSNRRGKNGNKWLHPDLVGMQDLTSDWKQEIKSCVEQYSDNKTKLWSFEVKLEITRSNVRQAFFQAVSNSSWANYSYLVAEKLESSDASQELQILSALHGVGFILLDSENPIEKSQVLIPAKERTKIDWDTANRLVEENPDFSNFINEVTYFYKTGQIKPADWYTIIADD